MLAGCVVDRLPGAKYWSSLRFAELDLRPPLPRMGTLWKFRAGCPADAVLVLRVPRNAVVSERGALKPDDAMDEALGWTLEAAEALDARGLLVQTPAELPPGSRSHASLREFFERLPDTRDRIWAPAGAWDAETAGAVCRDLGLMYAFDPLHEARPETEIVYARLRALGHRNTFSDASLHDVCTIIGTETDSMVALDSPRSFKEAQRLRTLAATFSGEPP